MSLATLQSPSTDLSRHPGRRTRLTRDSSIEDSKSRSSHFVVNVRSRERLISALAGGVAVVWGLSSRSLPGKVAVALGSGLVYRGVSGHCYVYQGLGIDRVGDRDATALTGRERAARSLDILRSTTVQQSAEAVFRAWQKPETFARAMSHFASHTPLPGGRTRWTMEGPLGGEHSWVTEVASEEPSKSIRWQTVESAPFVKNLTLELHPAPGDRGTEMTLHLRLEPPRGVLGAALTKLFGKAPAWVVERALGNMKSFLEAGELPSLNNNPAARSSART